MQEPISVEQRLAALEDEVATLRQQVASMLQWEHRLVALREQVVDLKRQLAELTPKDGKNWLDDVIGSMKDYPEFEEVARLGAEIRRADRPTDDDDE